MTIVEAADELKAIKPHIESGMSIVGHDAYDVAIRALEALQEADDTVGNIICARGDMGNALSVIMTGRVLSHIIRYAESTENAGNKE